MKGKARMIATTDPVKPHVVQATVAYDATKG